MTGSSVGGRRRSRPRATPAPFWGADVDKHAVEANSSLKCRRPCSSCGGLSAYCGNCQPTLATKDRAVSINPGEGWQPIFGPEVYDQRGESISSTIPLLKAGVSEQGLASGAKVNSPTSLVRVPPEAKPGDKIVLTRLHQLDWKGGCLTSGWECSLADDQHSLPAAPEVQPPASPPEVGLSFKKLPRPTLPTLSPEPSMDTIDTEASTAAPEEYHQQMLEWGRNLYRQVEVLEQEKQQLQHQLSSAQDSQQKQERELRKALHRCFELETILRETTTQIASARVAVSENDHLRKQLSAYAVEIDSMRQEKEFREVMQCYQMETAIVEEEAQVEADIAEEVAEISELQVEDDEIKRQLAETEEAIMVADESQRDQLLQEKHVLEMEEVAIEQRQHEEEAKLEKDIAQLETLKSCEAELEKEVAELSLDMTPEMQGASQVFMLKALVKDYHSCLTKLCWESVQQTQEFQKYINRVRDCHGLAHGALQQHNDRLHRLDNTLNGALDHWKNSISRALLDECWQHWWHRLGFRRRKRLRDIDCSPFDISWEMASAQQGFVVEKVMLHENRIVHRGQISRAPRFVRLDASQGLLRIGRASGRERQVPKKKTRLQGVQEERKEQNLEKERKQYPFLQEKREQRQRTLTCYGRLNEDCKEGTLSRKCTTLSLREVTHIDYGVTNRASLLTDSDPYLCFSLCTAQRSFDFVCDDERTVQCLVLAISRVILCTSIPRDVKSRQALTPKNWKTDLGIEIRQWTRWVSGVVQTRGKFLALQGWCKIQWICLKEKCSLTKLFVRSLEQAAALKHPKAAPSARPLSPEPTSDGDHVVHFESRFVSSAASQKVGHGKYRQNSTFGAGATAADSSMAVHHPSGQPNPKAVHHPSGQPISFARSATKYGMASTTDGARQSVAFADSGSSRPSSPMSFAPVQEVESRYRA